jgi:hypothetical protein
VGGQVKLARQEYRDSVGGVVNQDLVVKLELVDSAVSADSVAHRADKALQVLAVGAVKLAHPVSVGLAVKVGLVDTAVKLALVELVGLVGGQAKLVHPVIPALVAGVVKLGPAVIQD